MKSERDGSGLSFYAGIPGNHVSLLVDGEQAYPAMLGAIAAARHSVALESYIYAADGTGRRFLAAMVQAAQRGVRVRVLIDGVGSAGTGARFMAPLLAAGGALTVYQPYRYVPTWHRDHRKLLVVDEATAFIGGINIGDAYAPLPWGGRGWHDLHAQVQGPAAFALGRLFARTWERYGKKLWRAGPLPAPAGQTGVQILESSLTRRHSVRRAYLHAIGHARQTVQICNAYCIPDRGVMRALRNACARGVRVQLLLAGTTDVRAVQYASRAQYRAMLRFGVEIYEWTKGVLHAKSAVIDSLWCSIGSYNMDRRSLVHNLEANIACTDAVLGAAMAQQFSRDVQISQRVDDSSWHRRPVSQKVLEQVFYKLRHLL